VIGSIPVALRWTANAGYAAVLVSLALHPSPTSILSVSVSDWLAHGIAYGVQTMLVYWALVPNLGTRPAIVTACAGATVFGAVTEGLQMLQPGRLVEARDLVANAGGALVAAAAIAIAEGVRRKDAG
jgi:VanZ family protein